jgi:hypothetical protein
MVVCDARIHRRGGYGVAGLAAPGRTVELKQVQATQQLSRAS